jgi:deoxycytidine triphosphate deaminase
MQVSLEEFHRQVSTLFQQDELPTAEERYQRFGTFDPYPEIPPSLLHSGHLATYAIMTGMLEPFDLAALLKPATYLVPLEGHVRYRDSRGRSQRFYLSSDPLIKNTELNVRSDFLLEKNSICYVSLRPIFRIPVYLAGRFNLLIRDVYRGLLVGTGPLVDPGFVGRLSIPLHNFTSNEYLLTAGEGFVYFEFTKLSWTNGDRPLGPTTWLKPPVAVQPPFPGSKNLRRTIDDYLAQATGGLPAENAISAEIRLLGDTSSTIVQRTRLFTVLGFVAVGSLVIMTFTAGIAGWQVYLAAQQVVQSAKTDVDNAAERTADQLQRLETGFTATVQAVQGRMVSPEQLRALQSQLDQTQQEVRDLANRLPSSARTTRPRVTH